MNSTVRFYRKTLSRRVRTLNHIRPIQDYFIPMIGNKKEAYIADLGCGPFTTIGTQYKDVIIYVVASDLFADEYFEMITEIQITPIVPVQKQDMEHLTYDDSTFDIVHCRNALDHSDDPKTAILEMIRVSKEWVYLKHFINTGERHGYRGSHKWNISLDGRVWNEKEGFNLVDFGFRISTKKNMVIARLKI